MLKFAKALSGFAVIHGDHTDVQRAIMINGMRVVQSRSFSQGYARTDLTVEKGGVVSFSNTTFTQPKAQPVVPDAAILQMLDAYRANLKPILGQVSVL